jgi:uncharacterized protein (TIGR03435 family)
MLVACPAVCASAWAGPQASSSPAGQNAPAAASSAAVPATDIAGIWQGTLTPPNAQHGTRFVIKITKDSAGYKAALYNADQGQPPLTFNTVTFEGTDIKLANSMLTVTGKLSPDGKTVDCIFNGFGPNPLPVSFARTDPDAAWPIPEPIRPMAADANPGFEVVTIKLSQPGRPGKRLGFNGTHFRAINLNVNDLIAIAYGMHTKQITGAPDWFNTDLYDIDGVPDVPGRPSMDQIGDMLQKLLADRFQLKFHHETKELSVYVIKVASGGEKMTNTSAAPTDPPGFGFRGLGDLVVRNLTMADFAKGLQTTVTDRPVVDQTGLTGRYDFTLKWTPDESQFAQFRGAVPQPAPSAGDNPNAPPSLYTAVQEQLGLRIEATKAPDDAMVIDHVEKPSPN